MVLEERMKTQDQNLKSAWDKLVARRRLHDAYHGGVSVVVIMDAIQRNGKVFPDGMGEVISKPKQHL